MFPHPEYYKPGHRQPLPTGKITAGKPLWELPILDYSHMMDDYYEKKIEAMLKITDGDVVRATKVLDTCMEYELHVPWSLVKRK